MYQSSSWVKTKEIDEITLAILKQYLTFWHEVSSGVQYYNGEWSE